jgi:hypothetical protein
METVHNFYHWDCPQKTTLNKAQKQGETSEQDLNKSDYNYTTKLDASIKEKYINATK